MLHQAGEHLARAFELLALLLGQVSLVERNKPQLTLFHAGEVSDDTGLLEALDDVADEYAVAALQWHGLPLSL